MCTPRFGAWRCGSLGAGLVHIGAAATLEAFPHPRVFSETVLLEADSVVVQVQALAR